MISHIKPMFTGIYKELYISEDQAVLLLLNSYLKYHLIEQKNKDMLIRAEYLFRIHTGDKK